MNAMYWTVVCVFLTLVLDSWFVYTTRISWDPLRAALVTVCMPARMVMCVLGYLKHCAVTRCLPRRLFAADFWLLPWALFWAAWDGAFVGIPVEVQE